MLTKTVAIYNCIFRDNGESDDVLLNHRTANTRLCESKGYQYKLSEEGKANKELKENSNWIQVKLSFMKIKAAIRAFSFCPHNNKIFCCGDKT